MAKAVITKRQAFTRYKKLLKKQLRETTRKHNRANQKAKEITENINRLKEIKENLEHFKEKSGSEITVKVPNWVNGVWIVGERNNTMVTMYKFSEFIREVTKYAKFNMNLPQPHMIGDDGIEVTMNRGDLLLVSHLGDIKDGGIGFRFSNVAPSDETGQLQYELALHRLGMGPQPCSSKSFLIVDGNFRKIN